MELRTFESDLEGHPTPRLPFVDVATGLARTGHLRGDRHRAERAADRLRRIAPTCCSATARLPRARCGKRPTRPLTTSSTTCARSSTSTRSARARRPSSATTWTASRPAGTRSAGRRWSSTATTSPTSRRDSTTARATSGQPTVLVARTLKGKGLSSIEGKDGWHGKALKSGEEADKALEGARGTADAHRCETGDQRAAQQQQARAAGRLRHAAGARLQDGRSRRHPRGVGHGARRRRQARPAHRRARRRREELHVQRSVREGRTRSFLRDVHRRAGHGRRGDGVRGARCRFRSRRRSPASSTARRISSAWPGSRC